MTLKEAAKLTFELYLIGYNGCKVMKNGRLFTEGDGRINWSRGWLRLWVAMTLLWFITVAAVIIVAPEAAWRLRERGTETIAVPPCKSGQPTCEPWERNWDGVDLPRGSVVGSDSFTPPGPFSTWRVAIAALGPPAAILVLGWLLAWVAAGFMRTPSRK
ncbi:hypothetical protein AJ87_26910 [Rhizobium yanglingense]|nr:hypothetical protein AJ87_26910 [Rhizobium yanglingense]